MIMLIFLSDFVHLGVKHMFTGNNSLQKGQAKLPQTMLNHMGVPSHVWVKNSQTDPKLRNSN